MPHRSSHAQGISDVAWTSDSKFLASASDDKTVKIWSATTVRAKQAPEIEPLTATGQSAADAQRAHQLRVLRVLQPAVQHPRIGLGASASRMSPTHATQFDESVRLWDVRTGRCIRVLPAHSDPVTAVRDMRIIGIVSPVPGGLQLRRLAAGVV